MKPVQRVSPDIARRPDKPAPAVYHEAFPFGEPMLGLITAKDAAFVEFQVADEDSSTGIHDPKARIEHRNSLSTRMIPY